MAIEEVAWHARGSPLPHRTGQNGRRDGADRTHPALAGAAESSPATRRRNAPNGLRGATRGAHTYAQKSAEPGRTGFNEGILVQYALAYRVSCRWASLPGQEFCSDMRRGVRGSRPPSWSRCRAWGRCSIRRSRSGCPAPGLGRSCGLLAVSVCSSARRTTSPQG